MHPFTAKQMTRSLRRYKTIWYSKFSEQENESVSSLIVMLLRNALLHAVQFWVTLAHSRCTCSLKQQLQPSYDGLLKLMSWASLSLYNTRRVCDEWVRHAAHFLHSVICFIYVNSKAYKEFEIDLHAQLYSIGLKSFAWVSHWSH